MDDLISRQAAIDAIEVTPFDDYGDYLRARDIIDLLPSAQPEPRWIPTNKLKLCPFCGSEVNMAYRSGGVCVVSCTCCKSDGPVAMVEDYLDFSDEVTNEEWNKAIDYAKAEAVKKWNMRPPMTNLTSEELEDFVKTRSAALYGATCREG